MRASLAKPMLTSLFALAFPLTGNATVDEPESATSSAPATMTPAIPATPARPHSASFDPHGKLDPETQIQIALQHKQEGRYRPGPRRRAGARPDRRPLQPRRPALREAGLQERAGRLRSVHRRRPAPARPLLQPGRGPRRPRRARARREGPGAFSANRGERGLPQTGAKGPGTVEESDKGEGHRRRGAAQSASLRMKTAASQTNVI